MILILQNMLYMNTQSVSRQKSRPVMPCSRCTGSVWILKRFESASVSVIVYGVWMSLERFSMRPFHEMYLLTRCSGMVNPWVIFSTPFRLLCTNIQWFFTGTRSGLGDGTGNGHWHNSHTMGPATYLCLRPVWTFLHIVSNTHWSLSQSLSCWGSMSLCSGNIPLNTEVKHLTFCNGL